MFTPKSTAILALAACLALPIGAQAATVSITTTLSGKNEVPANPSAASGRAHITLDTATNKLSWDVSYRGLTPTAGHFHGPAAAGSNAGVVVPFTGVDKSPIKGSATLTPAQAADLLSGKWYVNLHSAQFGGGEIRGQVTPAAAVMTRAEREAQEIARTRQLNEQQLTKG